MRVVYRVQVLDNGICICALPANSLSTAVYSNAACGIAGFRTVFYPGKEPAKHD